MFETATFESAGAIHTRSRNWMLATLTLNSAVLLTLILLPLIYPNSLPDRLRNLTLTAPPPPAAPAPSAPRAPMQPSPSVQMVTLPTLSSTLPSRLGSIRTSGATEVPGGCVDCAGDAIGTGIGTIPGGDPLSHTLPPAAPPHVVKRAGPINLSRGVAEGMLIKRVMPVYPALGRAMRVEGTVVLQAIISKTGAIEGLRVISGHPMLQLAAIDAVKQWRYRPYLLNDDPVEVETTINVIFSLSQ